MLTHQERLRTHSSAFDGLLSLIPAKYYYDDATQDQWQQKKKAKKDAAKDRMAKLDPENASSADSYSNGGASAKDVKENRAKAAETSKKSKEQLLSSQSKEFTSGDDDLVGSQVSLVFDDDGNEIGTEQPPLKSQATRPKKELLPEELEKRQQRRAELKERLASKINLLKEKRKAPGSKTGGPVKSREQMLAERKRKQEYKQEKLKRKRAAEEADEEEDDGETSDKSDADNDDDMEEEANDVLFGNIQFKDGTRMTSDLKNIRSGIEQKKKKGPANNDIKAHLLRLESKRRKLDQLSPEERKKAQEHSKWKGLIDQAEGIKLKNDEKLLKKALKRKERQKLKSEIEWKERKQVVKDTISARAKRREANLKARKENKGKKSKNQVKLRKFTGTVTKNKGGKDNKKRAGFEGSAKTKSKQKK